MEIGFFLIAATLFLAYANGANDNFKGVATLFGSGTTPYRKAIGWATVTTLAGSVASIFLAGQLVKNFSGKGLVPDTIAGMPEFLMAVAAGAALTVIAATIIGFPISTTHALTGALVGAGWVAAGSALRTEKLVEVFLIPLVFSPLVAMVFSFALYIVFRSWRLKLGVTEQLTLYAGKVPKVVPIQQPNRVFALASLPEQVYTLGATNNYSRYYQGSVLGIGVQRVLDLAHFASAGLVSFARGLNDTPKIVGLLVAVQAFGIANGMMWVAVTMAIGGLLNARKVADTMSNKITEMNNGQGFTANLVTGIMVLFASRWGVPVSTTHVSVGSLFGIGMVNRQGKWGMIVRILLAWVVTLPVAAFLSAAVYSMIIV
ncbi:MAG: inorganic phosphate transporter [Bacteroidetes bacterium]|nr:inorganic phosphate transporter [Bacteroidota bacterium]